MQIHFSQVFTRVFGIGPSTAKKWIDRGWTSVKEACDSPDVSKDWRVQWGMYHTKTRNNFVICQNHFALTCWINNNAILLKFSNHGFKISEKVMVNKIYMNHTSDKITFRNRTLLIIK